MRIDNPRITLDDEARNGVEEEVRSGFLDWLFSTSLSDDEGNEYMLGGSILSLALERTDVMTMNLVKGHGRTRQLPSSIYKLAEFPGLSFQELSPCPYGTLRITREEHRVVVDCTEGYHVECNEDNTWRIKVRSKDGRLSADITHTPFGPLWYGREKPSYLTQHSITYGYNASGFVEGVLTFDGKTVNVKGKGIRERYVAVDSSAAELGGWEDWGFVAFNELGASLYDMRLGMKDFAVALPGEGLYFPDGKLTIEHEDWAFYRALGGFLPMVYRITIETEGGILRVKAHSGNASTWGATHRVPDNPVATIHFDSVEGTFTYSDGRVRELTGGRGTMSVRQWHAYPQILPMELFSDMTLDADETKFDTL